MEPGPGGLVFLTSDDQQVVVDKHELRWTSKVFQDLLSECDTGQVRRRRRAGPRRRRRPRPPAGPPGRLPLVCDAPALAAPPRRSRWRRAST
jgi:hypothetical protein